MVFVSLRIDLIGGLVEKSQKTSEFGRAKVNKINNGSKLLQDCFRHNTEDVWMSHGDYVKKIPPGFDVIGSSDKAPYAIISNEEKNFMEYSFIQKYIIPQRVSCFMRIL